MPVDAAGNYVMNPARAKAVPAATDSAPVTDDKITIDPATLTMTVGGKATPFDTPQALCEALEQQLGAEDTDNAAPSDQAGM